MHLSMYAVSQQHTLVHHNHVSHGGEVLEEALQIKQKQENQLAVNAYTDSRNCRTDADINLTLVCMKELVSFTLRS